ncbi:unnamed protein product [Arabidopsis thaliana]|uniref:Uncharacterized protein n=1 Tax=Arabidopsis thaliana TaxID=3702 RepID=A0A654EKW0_ARATH|nr:unnamed protein product [Arabidopsis thaliana]
MLLVHKVNSHVKYEEELPQKSTNCNGKNVAHQVFDKNPLRVTSKEKQRKYLKGWKFKFKTSSKRRKSMNDQLSLVEETAFFYKDPKEISWCHVKEFKETVAAHGRKIIYRFKLLDESSKAAFYNGTIQIRVWDSGRSSLECVLWRGLKRYQCYGTEMQAKEPDICHRLFREEKYINHDEMLELIPFRLSSKTRSYVSDVLHISLRDGKKEKQITGLSMADGVFMNKKEFSDFSLFNRVWEPGGDLVETR